MAALSALISRKRYSMTSAARLNHLGSTQKFVKFTRLRLGAKAHLEIRLLGRNIHLNNTFGISQICRMYDAEVFF